MDYSSILKSEIFRPFTTVFIPGATALWPIFPIIVNTSKIEKLDVFENSGIFGIGFVIFSISLGLIFDSIGSNIEAVWDRIWNRKTKTHLKNWNDYLQLKIKNEFVGQRYLQTRVLLLKFELSMIPAGLLMAYLCSVGMNIGQFPASYYFYIFKWIGLILALIMAIESFFSVRLLDKIRKQILDAVKNE